MNFYRNVVKLLSGRDLVLTTVNQDDDEVITEVKSVVVPKIHQIVIIDRSGSMYSLLDNLVDQLKSVVELMGKEDLISVVWFSSPGQYKTLVKGAVKSPELIRKLDDLRISLGTTCFSEPIKEVADIVNDLRDMCPNISATLFTDGIPCGVPWGNVEEERRSLELVKSLNKDILSFNTIGYGNYYNVDFLKKLSAATEFGIFTHSSQISEYLSIWQRNFERISDSRVEQVHLEYPMGVDGIYLNRKFAKMSNLELYLSKLDKKKNQFFIVSDKGDFRFHYNDAPYETKDLKEEVAEPTVRNFLYAYAYSLYYANRRKESLEVLATLGDKALIDSHMSSYTFDECANHQLLLEKAAFNTGDRYVDGQAKGNYLPAKDAFCAYDLLNILAEESYYVPFHNESVEYKRIGKKTVDAQNRFKFGKDTVLAPFENFVFNKERCNLSLRMTIFGTVALDENEASSVGLPSTLDAFVYRNHTIIKDGNLNMNKLVALMPQETFEKIQKKKKILEETILGDKTAQKDIENAHGKKFVCAVVKLNKLPVINAMYDENISASTVFSLASELVKEEAYQKYLNYYWKQFESNSTAAQKKVGIFEGKTAAQIAVLEASGIEKSGSYAGVENKTPKNDECDSYETRAFEFVFKGISSLPKVDDVDVALKAKKNLTVAFEVMSEAKSRIERNAPQDKIDLNAPVVKTRDWLQDQLRQTKSKLFSIRGKLAGLKMAKLLTGGNFEGFVLDPKKNYAYEAGDKTLYMKMERVKEYF